MEGQASPFSDIIGSSPVKTQARYLIVRSIRVTIAQMLAAHYPSLYKLFVILVSNSQDSEFRTLEHLSDLALMSCIM